MALKGIGIVLAIFFTKAVICTKGYVKELHMNKKFYCEGASKYGFMVNSQLQCIHLCMRQSCSLLNYIMTGGERINCEVLSGIDKCSAVVRKENWVALKFKVGLLYYHIC